MKNSSNKAAVTTITIVTNIQLAKGAKHKVVVFGKSRAHYKFAVAATTMNADM